MTYLIKNSCSGSSTRTDVQTEKRDEANLGNLTSWKPLGHCRPITGRLYIHEVGSEMILTGATISANNNLRDPANYHWTLQSY
jgi:hypothetical protein